MPPRRNAYEISCMSDGEILRELYARIVGDGTENNIGIDKRVDRLEEKARRHVNVLSMWVFGPLCGIGCVVVDHVIQHLWVVK